MKKRSTNALSSEEKVRIGIVKIEKSQAMRDYLASRNNPQCNEK